MSEPTQSRIQWQSAIGALGIAAAVCALLMTQPAPSYPLGSDWGHHFTVAEFIWHPSPEIGYPLFRRPWYGWLVGALGEGMGYFEAAQLIGTLSAVVIVLAAGLGAWALGGPLVAPVAAVIAAWMPLVREGGLWVNHYPLLGAACGLALAAGAAASRWPRLGWVVSAGLAGGVAAAIDVRGEAVLPAVAVLVGIGLPWAKDWSKTGILTLGFLIGAAAVPAHWAWLDSAFQIPALEFEAQVKVQRAGVLGQIQGGTFQDPTLEAACAGLVAGPMDISGLQGPCAQGLRGNALRRLSETGMLPDPALLWLGLLVLIPVGRRTGRRLRTTVCAGIVFGLPVAALWVGMGWVTYFPRYVLPFAAVIAMALPVGAYRLLRAGSLTPSWMGGVAGAGALGAALLVWPGGPKPLAASSVDGAGADRAAGHFAAWVRESLQPEDFLVDCAGLAVDSLLLPGRPPYVRFPPGDPACADHIAKPVERVGQTYLITMHQDLPENQIQLAHSRSRIAGYGWEPVTTGGPKGYQLWKRESSQ